MKLSLLFLLCWPWKDIHKPTGKIIVQAAGEMDAIMKRGLGVAPAGMVTLCVCVCVWDYPAERKAPSSTVAQDFSSSAHYILSGNGKSGFHLICFCEAGSFVPKSGNLLFAIFEAYPGPQTSFVHHSIVLFSEKLNLVLFQKLRFILVAAEGKDQTWNWTEGFHMAVFALLLALHFSLWQFSAVANNENSLFASYFPAGFSEGAEVVFTIGCSGLWTAVLNVLVEVCGWARLRA